MKKNYKSIYNIIDIDIKSKSLGFIINQLKFINKTQINIEYKETLEKELRKRTLKVIN